MERTIQLVRPMKLTEAGELMITLLASQAQEESRATSENCKWRIRKKFEEGYMGICTATVSTIHVCSTGSIRACSIPALR